MTTAITPGIVVVGAGIVGAAMAYHLARRGAPVTLVDRARPASGATGRSFAWITQGLDPPEAYDRLRRLAIQDYRRLEQELGPALKVDWCGALTWERDSADTERFVRTRMARGDDVRLVEQAEMARLEPNLINLPTLAAYRASEGAVEPTAATDALLRGAQRAGAEIRLGDEVVALTANDRRVTGVRTPDGVIGAEVVVLAAGIGAGVLCEALGLVLPLNASPALLLNFRTTGRLVRGVVSNPDMEIRQASDTRLIAAEDYIDDSIDNGPAAVAQRALAAIRQGLRRSDGLALDTIDVGRRPIPADGVPVVGFSARVDGLYLAVMHAGVTMAPAIARLATSEILDAMEAQPLQACRLERFAPACAVSGE